MPTELSAQSVIYLISYCSLPLFNPATLNFFFLTTKHMFLLWQVFPPSFSLDVHSPSVPLNNRLSTFYISSIAGRGILLQLTRISQFCSLISHSTIQLSLGMLSKFVVISFFNFFSFEVKNVIVCFFCPWACYLLDKYLWNEVLPLFCYCWVASFSICYSACLTVCASAPVAIAKQHRLGEIYFLTVLESRKPRSTVGTESRWELSS